jgi:hypothetical protein
MYNRRFVIKEFMKDELDSINPSNLVQFVEGSTLESIQSWIDTMSGMFKGIQLKYKKPFAVVKDPIKRKYVLWTEDYGKGRK